MAQLGQFSITEPALATTSGLTVSLRLGNTQRVAFREPCSDEVPETVAPLHWGSWQGLGRPSASQGQASVGQYQTLISFYQPFGVWAYLDL